MYRPAGFACLQARPGIAAALAALLVLAAGCPASAQAPPGEGAVRLVAREDVNGFATGALQVFVDGRWGAVCSDRFDDRDANVACRQLGFVSGTQAVGDPSSEELTRVSSADMAAVVAAPFVLENLGCSGGEARLVDCAPQRAAESGGGAGCTPLAENYAFVACGTTTGPEEGSVRLAGGAEAPGGGARFGRLEVFFGGGWGTVCDSGNDFRPALDFPFSPPSAQVACRQLGFASAFLQPLGQPDSGGSLARVPIWLAGADCAGTEATLTSCPGVDLASVPLATCSHAQDVGLLCFNAGDSGMDGSLRLEGGEAGAGFEYGRLEIFLRGFWSNICSVGAFTPDAAQVACRALGYGAGASLAFPRAYRLSDPFRREPVLNLVLLDETLPVALADVDCDGSEASLLDCASSDEATLQCGQDNTVLACINTVADCDFEPVAEQGALRLIDGVGSPCDPLYTGVVEIFNDDLWSAICADTGYYSDPVNADVVCRQLGFPQGAPINGLEPTEDDSESEESEVASEALWLVNLQCRGPEDTLEDCSTLGGRQSSTSDVDSCRERLHVACRQFAVDEALEEPAPAAADGDVRLVEERAVANWAVGHLEVLVGGSWRQVCAAGFDSAEADVACRQLGYGDGTILPFFDVPSSGDDRPVFPDVGVTLPACTGSEATLLECGSGSLSAPFFAGVSETFGCRDDLDPGLTLACVATPDAGEEGALRLVGGEVNADVAFGVPQIFHAGAWGTFCDGEQSRNSIRSYEGFDYMDLEPRTFDDASATLACASLGFTAGFIRLGGPDTQAAEQLPPWLGRVSCPAGASDFAACTRNGQLFGSADACGATLELFCSNAPARSLDGEVRLVGGRADPGGAWEYGRLELRDRGVFVGLRDSGFTEALGRRGAQVACRQLGYAAGAEVIAGDNSALPGTAGVTDAVSAVLCQGDEDTLGECEVFRGPSAFCSAEDGCDALLCSNPSNCTAPVSQPQSGDVRLVPLADTPTPTAACDEVHFGAVEIFNAGRWGAVCTTQGDVALFTLDAGVVCRQLGFPFGRMYDIAETIGSYYGVLDFPPGDEQPTAFAWASEVVCTGTEARLDECLFTESPDNTLAGLPAAGATGTCFRQLGVACSQFDLVDTSTVAPPPPPASPPTPAATPSPPPAPASTSAAPPPPPPPAPASTPAATPPPLPQPASTPTATAPGATGPSPPPTPTPSVQGRRRGLRQPMRPRRAPKSPVNRSRRERRAWATGPSA